MITTVPFLGHSVFASMRYVRAVETSNRVIIEAVRLNSEEGHVLATWPKQTQSTVAVSA
jgi:hypothetical protein